MMTAAWGGVLTAGWTSNPSRFEPRSRARVQAGRERTRIRAFLAAIEVNDGCARYSERVHLAGLRFPAMIAVVPGDRSRGMKWHQGRGSKS